LERGRARQAVRLVPLQARWLKFVVTSNWGHPVWTEMNATAAHDDGSRPAGIGAALDAQGRVDLYGLYFDFGRATLRAESAAVLDEVQAWYRAHPRERLRIEGHTDAVGSERANDALSLDRAQAVADALVTRGLPRAQLEAVGHGARHPVASNTTDTGRARNRRVSVVIAGRP
jgi:OmpA-OmpF porin, OOP family